MYERNLDRLGCEIGTVLRLIRDCYPAMEEITARQPSTELRLNIVGALLDDIAGRWTVLSAGAVFPTGRAAFAGPSARLELRTIQFRPVSDLVVLRFGERANPRAVAVAEAAHWLVEQRDRWLNPPEWVEWVDEPVSGYPARPVARDETAAKELRAHTLTHLYSARPQWLADAHAALDTAVAAAYGSDAGIADEQALANLMALNLAGHGS